MMKNNPTRILLVFGKLNRGGAETLAMNIYRKIDRNKVQFDFIVHTDEDCDYYDEVKSLGGKILHFPRYDVKNHFKYRKCWIDFFGNHPEYKVIHAHMTGSASVFLPIAKKYGLYTIAHSHIAKSQSGLRQKVIDLYRLPLKNISDYIFACSHIAGQWMFGKNVSDRDNYSILKNGIDASSFTYNEEKRKRIRQEFGLENQFVIGSIARFHKQKNHEFMMRIFKEVTKAIPDAVLFLVGNGELEGEIRQQVHELGLDPNVIFLGVRKDIADILSAMDVFLMPSFREGLPVSLVEAQASGIKIIASDVISNEIHLTDLIDLCSLDDNASTWAKTILKYQNGYERKNTMKSIQENGYDIQTTADWLQNFYLEHSK